MGKLEEKIPTDTWVVADWNEYIRTIGEPAYKNGKSYYYNEKLRIEMLSIGNDHASDHIIITLVVNLFAAVKNIPLNGKNNCTYRKKGAPECQTEVCYKKKKKYHEAQPDVSYYIGDSVDVIPWGTYIIDLNQYPAPNLVIEVAQKSLADDKGEKRLLYEDLGVNEYWIVDVENLQVIAFAIADGGSRRISESQVLPGLAISILEEALQLTREMNQSQVCALLMEQFQQ